MFDNMIFCIFGVTSVTLVQHVPCKFVRPTCTLVPHKYKCTSSFLKVVATVWQP